MQTMQNFQHVISSSVNDKYTLRLKTVLLTCTKQVLWILLVLLSVVLNGYIKITWPLDFDQPFLNASTSDLLVMFWRPVVYKNNHNDLWPPFFLLLRLTTSFYPLICWAPCSYILYQCNATHNYLCRLTMHFYRYSRKVIIVCPVLLTPIPLNIQFNNVFDFFRLVFFTFLCTHLNIKNNSISLIIWAL